MYSRIVLLTITTFFVMLVQPSLAEHPYPPSPVFSDLLGSVRVEKDGLFKINRFHVYFLDAEKGSMSVLKDETQIAEYTWTASPAFPPKYQIEDFELVSGKNATLGLKLDRGDYELVFKDDAGQTFYRFQFEVEPVGADDPYAPGQLVIDGWWENLGYLSKSSKEAHGVWDFKAWLRSPDGQMHQHKATASLLRDGKSVASADNNFRTERRWTLQTFSLKNPDGSDLYANKQPLADGQYVIKLEVDGQSYGTYPFYVEGGKILPLAEQNRELTAPELYFEGAAVDYWLRRE